MTAARPRWRTPALVLASLVVVSPFLLVLGFWALVQWSGCFISCSTPDRGGAVLAGGLGVLVLMVPVGVGLASARDHRRLMWVGIGLTVLVGVLSVLSVLWTGILGV